MDSIRSSGVCVLKMNSTGSIPALRIACAVSSSELVPGNTGINTLGFIPLRILKLFASQDSDTVFIFCVSWDLSKGLPYASYNKGFLVCAFSDTGIAWTGHPPGVVGCTFSNFSVHACVASCNVIVVSFMVICSVLLVFPSICVLA